MLGFVFAFKKDPHNPDRRYCASCDQQHDQHEVPALIGTTYLWESMGEIKDINCACHKAGD